MSDPAAVQNTPENQATVNSSDAASLFTVTTLASLQGAALAVTLVTKVLTILIGESFAAYSLWVGFLIAMAISLLIAYYSNAPNKNALTWIVAGLNGLLVFSAVIGLDVGLSQTTGLPSTVGQ